MSKRRWKAGNSRTKIELDDSWLILDVGSGHQPHPRADMLVDKYFNNDESRSGVNIVVKGEKMICADAERMPFADKTFDFVIASHIAEHIAAPISFCNELMRVANQGYLETPSKFTELTRGAPYHLWYISVTSSNGLLFEPASKRMRDGMLGKIYYHFCNFNRPWMQDSPLNVANPLLRFVFRAIGFALRKLPIIWSKDLVYVRLFWTDLFEVTVVTDNGWDESND